jgi:Sec-independent protein translocase protein TatA
MAGKKLRSRSVSVAGFVEEAYSETADMEAELNTTQENEPGRDTGEVNSVEERQRNSYSESNNNGVTTSQLQEFMSNVMKEFGDLKTSIKAVSDEMTFKIEIANKNLAESLTKQFREEHDSLKREFSNKLR